MADRLRSFSRFVVLALLGFLTFESIPAAAQIPAIDNGRPAPILAQQGGFPPGRWSRCAGEHEFCDIPYPAIVIYGANGAWVRRAVPAGEVDCSNRTFGDPIRGVRKACYVEVAAPGGPRGPGPGGPGWGRPHGWDQGQDDGDWRGRGRGPRPGPGRWSQCAEEHEPCYLPYPTAVAYGAEDSWTIRSFPPGQVDCSNRTFGDPLRGVRKMCLFRVR